MRPVRLIKASNDFAVRKGAFFNICSITKRDNRIAVTGPIGNHLEARPFVFTDKNTSPRWVSSENYFS